MINAEVVHSAAAALGEGCIWSPLEDLLVWVDITGQAVHRFDHASGQPVSAWRYNESVGNAALPGRRRARPGPGQHRDAHRPSRGHRECHQAAGRA